MANRTTKRALIALLVISAGMIFGGEGWPEEASIPAIFSGIVTKVDPERKGFNVQNNEGEIFFQWTGETKIVGSPPRDGGLIADSLKEGMAVTVFFRELEKTRVAGQIEVKRSSLGTLKGWEHPFGCGVSVC